MTFAVPGWHAPTDVLREPGRPGIGDVLNEIFSHYRRRAGQLLLLAAVLEGITGLLTLPYLATSFDSVRRIFIGGLVRPDPGASQPVVAGPSPLIAGVATAMPVLSLFLMILLVAGLLFQASTHPRAILAAARRLDRNWASVLPFFGLIALYGVYGGFSSTLLPAGSTSVQVSPETSAIVVANALVILVGVVILMYAWVRWIGVLPALMVEDVGLRAAARASSRFSQRRRGHTALLLVAVSAVSGVLSGLLWVTAAAVYIGFGGDGPLATGLGLIAYLGGRIVMAPILPISISVIYNRLRKAGPLAAGPPTTGWVLPG